VPPEAWPLETKLCSSRGSIKRIAKPSASVRAITPAHSSQEFSPRARLIVPTRSGFMK